MGVEASAGDLAKRGTPKSEARVDMARVLIISDNRSLIEEIKKRANALSSGKEDLVLRVLAVSRGDDVVEFVSRSGVPDVIVLDLEGDPSVRDALAKMHQSMETLRAQETPIIARMGAGAMEVLDFSLGLGDFVESSGGIVELLTRIRFVLWRLNKVDVRDVIRADDLVIDPGNYDVKIRGRSITLTFKEYELLRFLATHPGKVFTRDRLLNHVWGYDYYGGSRTVDVHVRRLRSKLRGCRKEHIETLRNVGYRFVV